MPGTPLTGKDLMTLFGRRSRTTPPPNLPFLHGDRCKTPAAQPEWFDSGDGRWERVCSCGSEYQAKATDEFGPASRAAEPSRAAHVHFPQCEGSGLPSVVTVEFSTADGCWKSFCLLCTTSYLYWLEDRVEEDDDGELRTIRRAGNVLYAYELARPVPA